jgi:hypothetical protein
VGEAGVSALARQKNAAMRHVSSSLTVRRATATMRMLRRSWKAALDMCCSAMKLRLFCAKKTKPGIAYL